MNLAAMLRGDAPQITLTGTSRVVNNDGTVPGRNTNPDQLMGDVRKWITDEAGDFTSHDIEEAFQLSLKHASTICSRLGTSKFIKIVGKVRQPMGQPINLWRRR